MSKIIIFDFDGTIADTFSTVVDIVNDLSEEFGYKKIGIEEIANLRHHRAQDLIKIFRISLIKIPAFMMKVKMLLGDQVTRLKPFDGISEALSELKQKGYTLGILSSNAQETIESFLKQNNLHDFDFVYCEKDLFGKARVLKKLIRSHGFNSDDVVYVGDETRDAEAAHKAGVKVVSVGWGFNSERALESVHPDIIISRTDELVRAIEKIN